MKQYVKNIPIGQNVLIIHIYGYHRGHDYQNHVFIKHAKLASNHDDMMEFNESTWKKPIHDINKINSMFNIKKNDLMERELERELWRTSSISGISIDFTPEDATREIRYGYFVVSDSFEYLGELEYGNFSYSKIMIGDEYER